MTLAVSTTLEQAYATCAALTRHEARNFYHGIRLLPPAKRAALCAIYALARRVDDIGDGDLPAAQKSRQLAALRCDLAAGRADDPVLAAVLDTARRFPVPLAAFDELVDGVEMDLAGRRYDTFAELVTYCRCVAGSVGRLCLGVYGSDDPQAPAYADALGIALQQVNILRDIREDLHLGRVYLPREDLDAFGVQLRLDDDGALADPDGALQSLVRAAAARAVTWYAEGDRLLPVLDRRSAACTGAMAGIYRGLLARIAAEPHLVLRQRVSLPGRAKAVVALRALAGVRP